MKGRREREKHNTNRERSNGARRAETRVLSGRNHIMVNSAAAAAISGSQHKDAHQKDRLPAPPHRPPLLLRAQKSGRDPKNETVFVGDFGRRFGAS